MSASIVAQLTGCNYGHMWGWGSNGWGWLSMSIMMVAGVSLVAVVVFGVARYLRRGGVGDPSAQAKRLLAERFARGEITPEEYRERLDQLGGVGRTAGRR